MRGEGGRGEGREGKGRGAKERERRGRDLPPVGPTVGECDWSTVPPSTT